MAMELDPAVLALLNLDPSSTTLSPGTGGGMSSASTSKITTLLPDGSSRNYFLKTGRGRAAEIMFAGEDASLNAIHAAVPTLCPRSHGHGRFASDPAISFLVTDHLDSSSSRSSGRAAAAAAAGGGGGGMSLAQKLARLHTTPAPIPPGFSSPLFGFPVPTCCGDTPQDNTWTASWAEFYADRRLRSVGARARRSQGADGELDGLIEQTCTWVVPRLIGDARLRNITPVVVHGDLWSGNAQTGRLPGMSGAEAVVFDASASYAHSEFELGIMKMFGGFGGMMDEYHALVPKAEPVAEYEDRVRLYELYHHLNHHALFGGGYRSGAVSIMRDLIRKYGDGEGKSEL